MIKVVSALRSLILNNPKIRDLVKDNVYPVVIPLADEKGNVKYPCMVITRTGMIVDDTKDKEIPCSSRTAQVELIVLSDNYDECADIADMVYDTVMRYEGTQNNIYINDIRYDSSFEQYSDNAYRQVFNFNIRGK